MYKDQISADSCGMEVKCNRTRGIFGCETDTYGESMDSCKNMGQGWGIKGYPLASVYAPLQNFDEVYNMETALEKGTVFCELDLPFRGESIYRGGGCRG